MAWSEIKYALNSTLGTDNFMSLDELISYKLLNSTTEYKTPGSYVYTIPAWASILIIDACGGGGGGGATRCNYSPTRTLGGAGGGGGAAIEKKLYRVKDIGSKTINITVGSGGSGGTNNNTHGSSGSSTVIGSLITLPGGSGGRSGDPNNYGTPGGRAGGVGGGDGGRGGKYSESESTTPPIRGSSGLYPGIGISLNWDSSGGGGGSLYDYHGCGGSGGIGFKANNSTEGYATGKSGSDGYVKIVAL